MTDLVERLQDRAYWLERLDVILRLAKMHPGGSDPRDEFENSVVDSMGEAADHIKELWREIVTNAARYIDAHHEKNKHIEKLERALRDLVQQIECNDFEDSFGHEARMLKAYHDARTVLEKKDRREPNFGGY